MTVAAEEKVKKRACANPSGSRKNLCNECLNEHREAGELPPCFTETNGQGGEKGAGQESPGIRRRRKKTE